MTYFFEAVLNWVSDLWRSPAKCIAAGNNGDYVILVHALNKTYKSMQLLGRALSKEGYIVVYIDMPARKYPIEVLALDYLAKTIDKVCIDKKKKIHLVGHSIGAIVIRQYLQRATKLNIGRVVMLAPPNRGSEMAEFVKKSVLSNIYYWWFGPSAAQLGTSKNSYVNMMSEEVKAEVGIIAGDYSFNPFVPFIIKGKNDGIVSVRRTKLKGIKEHLVLHVTHCTIIHNSESLDQISYFLSYGRFYR